MVASLIVAGCASLDRLLCDQVHRLPDEIVRSLTQTNQGKYDGYAGMVDVARVVGRATTKQTLWNGVRRGSPHCETR
ncbi:hypothetical protein DFS33DRAFT_1313855 [Desarmillaria ectypa]|nr:hypothetical protein DFS33DRAFT_1313855 [Desarmillaria ectypa]